MSDFWCKTKESTKTKTVTKQPATSQKLWLPSAVEADGVTVKLNKTERKAVQKSLSYLGVYRGKIDGSFGRGTKKAVAAARKKLRLSAGDTVDVALLLMLPNIPAIDQLKSTKARRYSKSEAASVNEPRLAKAMQGLTAYTYKFDYYQGHLYLAVINSGNDGWNSANR